MKTQEEEPAARHRGKLMHDLRGAVQSLFLLEEATLRKPAGAGPERWVWAYERVFSEDGQGLVTRLLNQLGYSFKYADIGITPKESVQGYLKALRVLIKHICALEETKPPSEV